MGCNTHFPFRVMDVDHVLPRSKGGTDHPDNLQLLCSGCNRSKGGKTMAEGRRLLLGSEATNTPQTCMVDAKIVMPLRSLSNDKHNDKHRLVPGGKITAGNRARQECYRSWEIDATR
ncbi:MAG: HNH endonuclease [Cyanobacteria bacterium MAG CAR4_bin_6]|nr:HNH endonuclease [Cyanobacteria bacterium MAG CAR4_bin_6]